jgi:Leucine-rich repeat (LRR) protein
LVVTPDQGLNGLHLKYNKIAVVPSEIGFLQHLQELDLEGILSISDV